MDVTRRETAQHVPFTEMRLLDLWELAKRRNGSKHPDATRRKSDIFTDVELDYIGLIGEAAVEDVCKIPIDRHVYEHGDNGDGKLSDGRTIAVKFNHRMNGYLLFEERQGDVPHKHINDFQYDVAILVSGYCDPKGTCYCREPTLVVKVAGYVTREQFLKKHNTSDWGLGNRFWMRQSELSHPLF